jgi:hypothetical protein
LNAPTADLYFNTGNANKLILTYTGNVGIGTPLSPIPPARTTSSSPATASGLSEVRAYIQANHPLPDIPSEVEVNGKCVSLGEMQSGN